MNDLQNDAPDLSILAALPVGVCLYGFDRRLLTANSAYCAMLGLPSDTMRPGASFIDGMRVLAYQGIFGPGDPEQQARALDGIDLSHEQRLRRRQPDGRFLELAFTPVADGRLLVCVTDQTRLVDPRTQAETASRQMTGLVDSLPLGIGVFDTTRSLVYRNPLFAELLGIPAADLRPGTAIDALRRLQPDELAAFTWPDARTPLQALELALRPEPPPAQSCQSDTGETVELAASHRTEGGWIVTLRPLVVAGGDDPAAQRRQRLTGRILETLPHGVCVYGPDRRVRMFNCAYAALAREGGVRVGDPFEASPFRQDGLSPRKIDLGEPQTLALRGPGGSLVEMHIEPLPDAGFACIVSLTRPAAPAEAVPDRLEAMLHGLHHGVLLWDANGQLAAANPRAAELLELPDERLSRGRSHREVLADLGASGAFGTAEQTVARLRELQERDRTRHHLHRRSNRNGRMLEVNSDPVAGGGFVVTYTDVTEYRQAEEGLRRAREAAEAASNAKSRFLATMSHELRTPLNAVIGYSEALAREANDGVDRERLGDFTRRAAEFATTINKAGQDLLTLINNILDVARVESGRFDLTSDRIELPSLVAGCVRQATATARAAEVTIYSSIPSDLPVLRGDERRLRQVLSHLIANAVKFTEAGGSVRIDASLVREGDLLLSVSDTGIGIPEADLDRVFEPFYQVDGGLSRRAAGTGLGLYFCRSLITAHGGALTLASRPGQGTTMVLRLPRSRLIEAKQGWGAAPNPARDSVPGPPILK